MMGGADDGQRSTTVTEKSTPVKRPKQRPTRRMAGRVPTPCCQKWVMRMMRMFSSIVSECGRLTLGLVGGSIPKRSGLDRARREVREHLQLVYNCGVSG